MSVIGLSLVAYFFLKSSNETVLKITSGGALLFIGALFLRQRRENGRLRRELASYRKISEKVQEEHSLREKEAAALLRLSQASASSLAIDVVLKIILDQVAEIVRCRAVCIMLYNRDKKMLEVVAAHGWSHQISLTSLALQPGQGILGEAFQTEKLIFVPDVQKDPRVVYREAIEQSGIASMIAIPLVVKGRAIGVMGLYAPFLIDGGKIEKDRLGLLSTISSQVAISIDNAKLYQDLETNVSELKKLQGQLIQTEKLSAIGELVSGVAHEINNPLTSVIGFTQLLMETAENPRDKEFLERIFSEAMSCSEIIRNLLTFARRHPAERSPRSLNDVIQKALDLKIYQLETDGIEVVQNFSGEIPPLLIDPFQLQQVFFNIINNAHQALLEKKKLNDGKLKLTITSEIQKESVVISFQDTGPGIAPGVLPKIFEPFFTTKEIGVGTGLGLSISYGIIKEHGGEVWVENQFGVGVTFLVTLPINEWVKTENSGRPLSASLAGKRILLADNSVSALEMCAYVLRLEGFQVDTVGSGRLALERVRTDPYDLIIIDLKMSDIDGLTFYEKVSQERPILVDKVLFSTDGDYDLSIGKFLEEKGWEALGKPFSVIALKEAVYRRLTASLNA